jgi:nucleotide-binding universal stress UspA family protein
VTTSEDPSPHPIVVGIDGSEPSLHAVRWAARQAELTGSPLEVIMTWEWPASYGWPLPLPSDYDPASDAEKLVTEATAEVRKVHPDLQIRIRVVEGHPAPTLVEASRGADLLVVGSRGHGEFAGMLIGSVSEHCVTNAYCPVVVFRDRQ